MLAAGPIARVRNVLLVQAPLASGSTAGASRDVQVRSRSVQGEELVPFAAVAKPTRCRSAQRAVAISAA